MLTARMLNIVIVNIDEKQPFLFSQLKKVGAGCLTCVKFQSTINLKLYTSWIRLTVNTDF